MQHLRKKRKTQVDKVDEEVCNTSKLIQQQIEKLFEDDVDSSKKRGNHGNSGITENAYCAAVVQCYRDLSPDKKFEGFVIIMKEIQDLKLHST